MLMSCLLDFDRMVVRFDKMLLGFWLDVDRCVVGSERIRLDCGGI